VWDLLPKAICGATASKPLPPLNPPPAPPPSSEREKMMSMSGLSIVVIFFLTNVASVVFSALMFGAALVAAHGATRVPDDLFIDDADANQGLLSILTGSAQTGGAANV